MPDRVRKVNYCYVTVPNLPGQGEMPGSEAPGGVVGRIMDFVECKPRYKDLIEYLLRDVFVVENLEKAF